MASEYPLCHSILDELLTTNRRCHQLNLTALVVLGQLFFNTTPQTCARSTPELQGKEVEAVKVSGTHSNRFRALRFYE